MTRAILLVDHGSRRAEANAVLETVADLVRARRPDRIVATAHMELATPTVADGVAACVAAGADDLTVVPYFLGPGSHTTADIPRLVAEAAAKHPALRVRTADPLGAHDGLVDAVLARADAADA